MKHMISPDEAFDLVIAAIEPMPSANIAIDETLGLVLCEDIVGDRDYPPFARAMMDGYAVRLADAGKTVPVTGEVAAGGYRAEPLIDGTAVSIMTGAPCPPNTEVVVPHEETSFGENGVTLPVNLEPDRHIARQGSECPAGHIVARRGDVVTPLVIANLATFGYQHVAVTPAPRCSVVTTGSELARPDTEPGLAQIRDSNGPMMAALMRTVNVTELRIRHAADTEPELESVLREVESQSDIVILTGGVSAGKYDLVPGAVESCGYEIVFHKVSQKPGKPLLFARKDGRFLFGLPGNPLACHMCFNRYIAPAVRKMMGKSYEPQTGFGTLSVQVVPRGSRTRFMPCRTIKNDKDGWVVDVLKDKGSADIFATCPANSYIRIEPDAGTIDAGTLMPFTRNWDAI